MSARDEARAVEIGRNAQPWSLTVGPDRPDGTPLLKIHADGTVTGAVEDASEAGRAFVEYLRASFSQARALLGEPVPADEREALIDLVNDARLRPGTGRTMPEVAADVILAAGFRRQGPITDAQVEAGCVGFYNDPNGLTSWQSLARVDPRLADKYRVGMRAALEAARDAS